MTGKIIAFLAAVLAFGSAASSIAESNIRKSSSVSPSSGTSLPESSLSVTEAPVTEKVTEVVSAKKETAKTTAVKKTAETTVSEKKKQTEASSVKKKTETVTETEAPEADYKTITLEGKQYTLTFEDDFNGTELDPTKWKRCPEWKRQDLNNYWDDDMSYLDGEGNLIIEMRYDENSDRYLSGGIRSKGKFEQTYGYYEIRCAVNNVPGYWTAFWLMGESVLDISEGGRNGTEIDIFETPYFDAGEVQHTLNWDGYEQYHKSLGNIVKKNVYDGEFHTFALLWTKDEYVFYIDGEETWRTDAKEAKGTCQVPLYMKITSETGSWTNVPDSKNLPDYMKTDYVRVYAEK